MTAPWVQISAHRGGAENAPLASWEAYVASVDTAADYVEFDVRRTSDDTLVAHHDEHLTGVPGRPAVRGTTYRRMCELLGHRVPTVPDLLELIAGHARGHLDLKETGYERRVLGLARDILGPDGFVVSTTEEDVVCAIREDFPGVAVGLTLGRALRGARRLLWPYVRYREARPLARLRRCGAGWVVMHHAFATAGVLGMCAREGLRAAVWTVNRDARIDRYLTDPRVGMLITDRPRFAAERRAALADGAGPATG